MKVFMNKRQGAYSGGMILVAANSAQEAHELCLNSDELEYVYWEWASKAKGTKTVSFYQYSLDNWQEVPNLWYAGVNPCVIAEEGYSE